MTIYYIKCHKKSKIIVYLEKLAHETGFCPSRAHDKIRFC